jgi:L-galactono-1,4-lactone dehydrogenase
MAFSQEGMVSLALLDEILQVDPASKQVRVQAGARVQEVVEALRPHGLTLQNYASIREQSIGGFTQARLLSLRYTTNASGRLLPVSSSLLHSP